MSERLEEAQAEPEAVDVEDVADAPEPDSPEPEQPERTWAPDDEAEARKMGWKPADEWRGDLPANFTHDPREYVEKNNVRFLKSELAKQAREFAEWRKRQDALAEKRLKWERERAKAEIDAIRKQQEKAVELGDVDAYRELRKREEALGRPVEPDPATPQVDPDDAALARDWHAQNAAVVNDKVLYAAADVFFGEVGNVPMAERLAYVDKRLREEFPHKFGQQQAAPQRPAVARVDGGGINRAGAKDPFDALPSGERSAAREQFKRDVEAGYFRDDAKGRASWVKEYMA